MKLVLSDAEHAQMKAFYESELDKTVRKLQHLENELSQLKSDVNVHVVVAGMPSNPMPASPGGKVKARKPRKGQRGRKSIWGDFILRTVKENNRPMLYSEIIQAAKIRFNIPDAKMKTLRAAINQSAFRLRTVHKKINTVGKDGRKEKHIALSAWFDDKGNLREEYSSRLS